MTDVTELNIPDAVPAASVIVLRQGSSGMEVLLLRRSAKADYLAEAWVFPGGMVEPEDGEDPNSLATARIAASRETREEAGIVLDPASLVPYSQWCPPPESPKRFLTWFFVAELADRNDVAIDGAEITDHIWVRPADGLAARDAGTVTLMPPTWMALHDLCELPTIDAVLDVARGRTPPYWETHIAFVPRTDEPDKVEVVALWEGDAGYDACDAAAPGPRNRLHMGAAPWTYEFTDRPDGVGSQA